MKRYLGQSLAEYGLIISLVALVGLAGVILLGGSIRDGLASLFGSPSDVAVASTVPAAQTGSSSGGNAGAAQLPTATAPTSSGKTIGATYDPKTGMIILAGLDSGTSGKTTTSSQGTEAAALALQKLALVATKDDGSPADPNISGLISKLSDLGQQMAQKQANLTLPPSKDTSSAAYLEFYNQNFDATRSAWADTYNTLKPLIEADPNYSKLFSQVNDYSGIISSIQDFNIQSQYAMNTIVNGASVPLTPDRIRQYLTGTDITTTPINVPLEPVKMTTATVNLNADGSVPLDSTNTDASSTQLGNLSTAPAASP